MYNHKVKKVKFLFCKSKLLKEKTKVGNVCVFFLENVGNNLIKCTFKIKRSFWYNLQSTYWDRNVVVGGGIISEKSFYLEDSFKEFLFLIGKQKSCIIFYNQIYWTLRKVLNLNLDKNSIVFLVMLLSYKLKKTLSFFLPFKSLLVNFKVKSGK